MSRVSCTLPNELRGEMANGAGRKLQGKLLMNEHNNNAQGTARTQVSEASGPNPAAAVQRGRRRLIAGGMGAAPVLMVLSSRSALATQCLTPSRMMSGNMSPHGDNATCTAGQSPGYYKVFQSGKPRWPSTITNLPVYDSCTSSTPTWSKYTQSGTPPLNKFKWSPTLKGGEMRVKPNSGAPIFGGSFVSLFSVAGGLVPVMPTFSNNTTAPAVNTGRAVSLWEVLAYPESVHSDSNVAQLARHCIAAYFNALKYGSDYPITKDQAVEMWVTGRLGNYCPAANCSDPWGPSYIVSYIKSTLDGQSLDF